MNLNIYIKGASLALVLLTAGACENDFEEINRNPNQPEQVNADLLLPDIIRRTVNEMVGESWNYGNIMMQYTSKIQFTSEDRYDFGPRDDPWGPFYDELRDLNNMVEIATENEQNNILGVALVMKSWMYHILTDAYGDIPYAEATKGKSDANYFPAYDPQQAVYEGILADLKQANSLLGTSNEAVSGDILYDGNLSKWKKFANSLQLRIHMRLSDRIDPSAAMSSILSDPNTYPIFEDNEDQAALTYLSASPNQWPQYTNRSGSYDEIRMSTTMEAALKERDDPRLFVYYQPTNDSGEPFIGAEEDYAGVPNGLADEAALQYSPSGDPAKGGSNFISRVGLMFACLTCNPNTQPNAAEGIVMSYAELLFILAEAAERGFIGGDPAEFYQNGIQASFDYYNERVPAAYGISVTPGPDYFTQPNVAYTGTQAEKLLKIGTQKWIALFFSGLEAWFDWRRTGIPTITPGPDNVNNDRVPVRFGYPTSEQLLNGDSYKAAVARQGQDTYNTRVWWDID
ncbi:SusD/RagB family nutrient-binding outer membrane lipoprotein [Catalinimonas niigatensis]|uniref:SusD/RagB family nutrient-binding outer membrane lipoprotein n=1 Tax=Catalinimonas niigatensis TaxID=1397264 RepID=UPI002666B977|nr:SusD/RagB family nutrient-binding outer membrane lipoprotein [Catalinimonas niigatensis]WPP50013.1 SusD/RagB family nutrient-binding outer membrane lipoprotein [Catalinimonas niigatensis]